MGLHYGGVGFLWGVFFYGGNSGGVDFMLCCIFCGVDLLRGRLFVGLNSCGVGFVVGLNYCGA